MSARYNQTNSSQTQFYGYNALDHLTQMISPSTVFPTISFTVDSRGNRTGTTQYNSNNERVDQGYDKEGNTRQIQVAGSAGNAQITYDAWGRVTKLQYGDVYDPAATTNKNTGTTTAYVYDAQGRRIKSTTTTGGTTAGTQTFYDVGNSPLEERNLAGVVQAQYVWSGAGAPQVVLRDSNADGNGATGRAGLPSTNLEQRIYALVDGRQDTVGLVARATDGTWNAVEHFLYGVDGRPVATTGNWGSYPAGGGLDATGSRYAWNILWRQDRFTQLYTAGESVTVLTGGEGGPVTTTLAQGGGLYASAWGGRWTDPQTGRLLSPAAVPAEENAYDPLAGASTWAKIESFIGGGIHTGLDVIGTIDPTGIADLTNAGLYALTGDYRNASISVAGALLPYAGDLLKTTRYGKYVVNAAKGWGDAISASVGTERALVSRGLSIGLHGGTGALSGAAGGFVVGGIDGAFSDEGFWSGAVSGAGWGAVQGGVGGAVRGFINPYICFVAGTRVVVEIEADDTTHASTSEREADGNVVTVRRLRYKTVAIEKLVEAGGGETGDGGGQFVVSRDQHGPDGPLVRRRITRTYQRTAYALQVLTLRDEAGDEQTLRVTEEHPFYVEYTGWTPARLLVEGDTLVGAEGTLTVVSNEHEAHPEGAAVYNLEVVEAHTYFVLAADTEDAMAVWVHNADGSYTNFHASGRTYSGKGDIVRANKSARRIGKLGDPLVAHDWTPAANATDSFVQEAIRIRKYGGPGGATYNKINSPGEAILRTFGI